MPEEALELKKNLRCDMKARRNALTDEEKKHAAANCLSKLKELPEFMNADWIYQEKMFCDMIGKSDLCWRFLWKDKKE